MVFADSILNKEGWRGAAALLILIDLIRENPIFHPLLINTLLLIGMIQILQETKIIPSINKRMVKLILSIIATILIVSSFVISGVFFLIYMNFSLTIDWISFLLIIFIITQILAIKSLSEGIKGQLKVWNVENEK